VTAYFRVLEEAQVLWVDTEVRVPTEALVNPVLMPLFVRSRLDEKFHLHLFEFAGAEK